MWLHPAGEQNSSSYTPETIPLRLYGGMNIVIDTDLIAFERGLVL
jgi:hypothetical protein